MGAQAEDANGETLPFPRTLSTKPMGQLPHLQFVLRVSSGWSPTATSSRPQHSLETAEPAAGTTQPPGLPGLGSLPSRPLIPAHPKTPSLFPLPLTHTRLLSSLSLSVYWSLL